MSKLLVACEESQTVCAAFRRIGWEAYSADILEPSGGHPEWHILGDVLPLINGQCSFQTMDGTEHEIAGRWDMLIAFPPCTYLSNAGANLLRIKGEIQEYRMQNARAAKKFFMQIWEANCKRICIENPVPGKIHNLPYYSQIIEPYMFGDPWKKRTCLWLKGLPSLMGTDIVIPDGKWVETSPHGGKNVPGAWTKKGTRKPRERAKTFPGVAAAMAEQWGGVD